MADWRQIQARIRKAKAGEDPPRILAELYEKTRDAMVAFELARICENSGQTGEAVRWYTTAAERFRRAQWKTKAEEALMRLGAPVPVAVPEPAYAPAEEVEPEPPKKARPEAPEAGAEQGEATAEAAAGTAGGASAAPQPHRRKRRGRRGGRRHRRQPAAAQPSPAEAAQTRPVEPAARPRVAEEPAERAPGPAARLRHEEALPHEPAVAPSAWQARDRAGEPALASRLAHLESQLRRLIASQLYRVDDADQAPAGPGVFIVSDSDQTTYYYIEACQTLRVGAGNLLRGERGARRGESLRARFADHLGISESRVSKYLKDHCAVRWLQLDEGAAALAHFAIAVLRPALND
jgi:hypothetical protein